MKRKPSKSKQEKSVLDTIEVPQLLTWRDVGRLIRQSSYEPVQKFLLKHDIKPKEFSKKNKLYELRRVVHVIEHEM